MFSPTGRSRSLIITLLRLRLAYGASAEVVRTEQAQRKTAEAEAYKKQIEEQQQQQKLFLISIAAFLVLIGTAAVIVFIVRRKITIKPKIGVAEDKAAGDRAAAAAAPPGDELARQLDAELRDAAQSVNTAARRPETVEDRLPEGGRVTWIELFVPVLFVPLLRLLRRRDESRSNVIIKDRLRPVGENTEDQLRASRTISKDRSGHPRPTEASEVVDQLAKFAELRANGTLTEEEFEELKAKLLGTPPKKLSQSDYIKQLRAMRDKGDLTEGEFQSKVLASLAGKNPLENSQ